MRAVRKLRCRPWARWLPGVLVAAASATSHAQRAADPYGAASTEIGAAAGYVGVGPFPLGDDHGTAEVEGQLGLFDALWIETAHFRIGSTLAVRPLPETADGRHRLYAECRQLRRSIPRVPKEPKALDAWLQMHLFAQRLEEVYADFARRGGFAGDELTRVAAARDGSCGPFLGSPAKFVVLLFEQRAQLARYQRLFCGIVDDLPNRYRFPRTGAHLVTVAADSDLDDPDRLRDPEQLHAHVVHAVVESFVDSVAGGDDHVPVWWRLGVAHWYVRRIGAELAQADRLAGETPLQSADWPEKLLARERRDLLPPLADVVCWPDERGHTAAEHATLWSVADFLMSRGDVAFGRMLMELRLQPMRTRFMPPRLVRAWHEAALERAYGHGIADLDRDWRTFLRKQYQ